MVQNSTENEKRFDYLWLVLFLVVFINGFEAGGYQASLWNIGQNYDLSVTSMGLFASVELFATMLAPLVLGAIFLLTFISAVCTTRMKRKS